MVSRAKPAAFSGNRKLQNPEVRALHARKTWAVWAGFTFVVEGLFLFLFQKKNSRKRLNTLMRSRTRSTGQWLAEGGLGALLGSSRSLSPLFTDSTNRQVKTF